MLFARQCLDIVQANTIYIRLGLSVFHPVRLGKIPHHTFRILFDLVLFDIHLRRRRPPPSPLPRLPTFLLLPPGLRAQPFHSHTN